MNLLIIIILAVVYPLAHGMNAWVFDFANINTHVSLIYLPAFLRLFNILVMGPFYGTLSTLLGGVILMAWFDEPLSVELLNTAASCAGPLIAVMGFRIYFKRRVQLTSLKDLAILTVAYALCNSLLHHGTWLFIDIEHFFDANTSLWMFIGDLNGALLGAYLFKASLDYLGKKGFNFSTPSQPKN
jgi:integral membrane sensor domain MASE1